MSGGGGLTRNNTVADQIVALALLEVDVRFVEKNNCVPGTSILEEAEKIFL